MPLFRLILILATFGVQASAQSGQYHGRVPLDGSFDVLTVRNSDGNRIDIHMRVDESDGVYVICMATTGTPHEDNEELKSYQLITLNGTIIMRGTDWSPHYRSPNGRQAVCQKTRARVVANPDFQTDWARYDF